MTAAYRNRSTYALGEAPDDADGLGDPSVAAATTMEAHVHLDLLPGYSLLLLCSAPELARSWGRGRRNFKGGVQLMRITYLICYEPELWLTIRISN